MCESSPIVADTKKKIYNALSQVPFKPVATLEMHRGKGVKVIDSMRISVNITMILLNVR